MDSPGRALAALAALPGFARRAEADDKWRRVGARVLPVFTGERVAGSVEESNELVRSCLRSDAEAAWAEITGIVRVGMASVMRSLYAHVGVAPRFDAPESGGVLPALSVAGLVGASHVAPLALAGGVAAAWATVYSHVVPALDAVFAPLALFRAVRCPAGGVRGAVLAHFCDAVVMPLLPRIEASALAPDCRVLLPTLAHMLAVLAALPPADRGPLHRSARVLVLAQQA
ncbi:hypothetical protein GGI04_002491 [Coemansia thaxteri]|uniref:Uncharacterized protein n=1 Tax=Coemansia thaxteri TaxID=2663907 RepID=A0A9W8BI70_9FUNG|nr:hypothetical protein H4R26_003378 [Coemansia thaxteri]KAJ2004792.1 hypothetical protein GGI04_002491 [Coemansia thaxteri]KAJ2461576.1 hypothetical protein GGI02_005646 [Coemansia sp. RSA 2322]KAJ2483712.1 hypothetical protein EV174_002875 [Coemansia sp. RSA 2320]